jgi:hypothetical protein
MLASVLALLLAAPDRVAVKPLAAGDALSERSALSLTAALAAEVQKRGGVEVVLAGGAADEVVAGQATWDGRSLVFELRLLGGRRAETQRVVARSFARGTSDDILAALPAMVAELLPAAPPSPPPTPALPTPASAAQHSAGRLVLHYHRRDGRYRSSSLYAWETFQRGPELRASAPGIGPHQHPPTVDPDGKDAFGVYWTISTARFKNGRVNFLVRGLDAWDECGPRQRSEGAGKALFWIVADGPEVWLDVPECELYATREEAERAQGR